MTDKLYCPFCGAELIKINADLTCLNYQCRGWEIYLSVDMWQALIDGKKAQDALNRAISEISELCFTVLYCSGEADNELELVRQHAEMVEEAKARIFSEITSITKQEE